MSCHVIVLDSNGLTSIYGFESRKGKCSTAGSVDCQFGFYCNHLPWEEAEPEANTCRLLGRLYQVFKLDIHDNDNG